MDKWFLSGTSLLTSGLLRRVFFTFVFTVLTGAVVVSAQAQAVPKSKLPEGNVDLGKVSSHLLEARRLARQGLTAQQVQEAIPLLPFRNHLPEIEVRLRILTPEIVAQVQAIGMQVTGVYYEYARIVGLCDPELLDEIAAIPEVTTIHPNYPPYLQTGSVNSQADASIRADLARSTWGVNGSGINVGVLSDSFNDTRGGTVTGSGCSRTLTGSTPQTSGDLPAAVTLLDNGPGGGTDEGAGMAELIHDLAPGSGIMFHTAFRSEADFAQGITELRNCGADVIVDDVFYFAEPMFQDGIVAQAAQAAVDNGVPYFSSAGNQATVGIDETYLDANPADDQVFPATGNDFHDFGGGDRFATITIPPGCGVSLVLQWNEPFSGTLGPGASSDLDLYVCTSANPGSCLFRSTDVQGCSFGTGSQQGDPLEVIGLTNTRTTPAVFHAAVEHFCGNENVRFRIAVFPSCSVTSGYAFESGIFDKAQTYGHAAAAGVEAVAAVFYGEIDTGGNFHSPNGQINVEPFSSLGGHLPFYFDGSGNPLPGAPVTRFKPDIAAPDGTNTTFFGGDSSFDSDTFPNFFGTSAAAPHAAAVAALMLDANPVLTPTQIRSTLASTATDIESVGVDFLSGAGLIDALEAVSALVMGQIGAWVPLPIGGATTAGPAAAAYNDQLNLVVRGTDDGIYHTRQVGGAWTGWTPVGGLTPSEPAAVEFNGELWAFVRGTDDRIYVNRFNGASWSGWGEVPGAGLTLSGPGAAVFNGDLYLFVRGIDNKIYQTRLTAGSWTGWTEVPGGGVTPAGPAAVVFESTLYLVVRGSDDRIYDNLLTVAGWTGWTEVPGGGLTPSKPAATVFGGQLWYFVQGIDARVYQNRLAAGAGGIWTGWSEVTGNGLTPSGPGAAAAGNALSVVVRGTDNRVYTNQSSGG